MSDLPRELRGPVSVALARPADAVPRPDALSGGVQYSPKWDGFRAVVIVAEGGATLWSRQGNDLTRIFPELATAAVELVPPGYVLDGEAVVWTDGRLDFDALQHRMAARSASIARLAAEKPASFVAFDILAVDGTDTRRLPLRDRWALLAELAREWEPPLHLSPATADVDEAGAWFEEMADAGIEGIVAKGLGTMYEGGKRGWVKVKRRRSIDLVCGAVTGPLGRPETVVVGAVDEDEVLRVLGRSSPLTAAAARSLARVLEPAAEKHPWPVELKPGAFSRDRSPIPLNRVEPLVVEVSADSAWSGKSFRHPVRFLRARPELDWQLVEMPRR